MVVRCGMFGASDSVRAPPLGFFTMKMKKSFVSAAVAVLGLCGMAAPAYKAQLTVQGYAGSDALADFPVPVRISESAIPGFRYADCAEDSNG